MKIVDFFNPLRWKAVFVFLLKKLLKFLDGESTPYLERHQVEQLAARFLDDNCSKCLDNGTCLNCGCHAEGRMNGWQDHCSAGHWGPMVDKERWNYLKKHYNIKFKVTYGTDN